MITQIRPKVPFVIMLIITIFLTACTMPVAPVGGGAAAPAGENYSTGDGESAAPAYEDSASESPAAAGDAGAEGAPARRPSYNPSPSRPDRADQYEVVTAGVTDDNMEWYDYLDYLDHNRHIYANQRDVSERYLIQVVDEAGLTVHDATVEIYASDTQIFSGRTDAGGQVYFHPLALETNRRLQQVREYRVVATKGYLARSQIIARYRDDAWQITIGEPERLPYAQLDLLFLIDATGSMGDEIDKLKATMADIADEIARLPEQPDVRYGLVAYRDRGDAFVVRSYDFTPRLNEFQRTLAALRADGGGDEPEALNEALHRSIHELSWREQDSVRLAILVADAPPHLDYRWERFSYDTDMIEAVRKGIKIFPVGASNLNAQGEYIFRQLAQFTGGKFVFLTYADGSNPRSGPGTETEHDVDNYSVDTLDRLVVRLVRDELAKLAVSSGAINSGTVVQQQPSPVPTPTPTPVPQPYSCAIDMVTAWTDCLDDRNGPISLTNQYRDGRKLYRLNFDPARYPFDRVRFDISYDGRPTDYTVNIGDAFYTAGISRGSGSRSNNAELQIFDDLLLVYGNDATPSREALDDDRLLFALEDAVRAGETISLEVGNKRLGINYGGGIEVVESPHLFALTGQRDRKGPEDYDLYATFNRTIDGDGHGNGVSEVMVTLYPAR